MENVFNILLAYPFLNSLEKMRMNKSDAIRCLSFIFPMRKLHTYFIVVLLSTFEIIYANEAVFAQHERL